MITMKKTKQNKAKTIIIILLTTLLEVLTFDLSHIMMTMITMIIIKIIKTIIRETLDSNK